MSLVRNTVANFIGGVSQQTDKLMYPNQSKVLINNLPDPIEGLKRRPPSEFIARLFNEPLTLRPYVHTIIKEDEEYQVFLTGDDIKVFTLGGVEKTVSKAAGTVDYITTSTPSTDLYAVTIADYTFILNKTKVTALKNDTVANAYGNSALVFVKQADYATEYKVIINDTTTASYTTPSSTSTNCTTSYIASQLKASLSTALGADFTVTNQGSVILITSNTSTAFTILTQDGNGDRDLFGFYNETSAIEDLPVVAPKGFILKIVGDDASVYDDYYVRFETADGSDFGTGTWQECPAPNLKYKIDASTMPHILVRQSNGTFLFKQADWTDRKAGDEDTAPTPSFIGNAIQEVLTYKSRLGFIAGDRSCYSDTQDVFSFFKRTTQTELDTDPIDVGSNSKMVLLRHSLPFNESLLLFSETAQFNLAGGDIFSNSTVSINLATEYQCSKYCKPITIGSKGFFVFENGTASRLMATYVTPAYTIDALDVTEQVPAYVPSGVYKLAGSAANNILLVLTKGDESGIYIYNSYYSGEKLVQSSWHKWEFKNAKILNVDIDQHLIYITSQYEDGVYLEKINLSPKLTESDLDFLLYLDHKLYHSNLSYNETSETTTINLPYTPDSDRFRVIDVNGFPVSFNLDGAVLTVNGEYTKLITGEVFESSWKLPVIYVREQTQNGGIKVKEGTLMLRDINLAYAETGEFKVTVTPKYSTQITSVFEFTGKILGMSSSTLGKIPVSSGTFLIPIISKNDEIEIVITNDGYLPSCFLSMEWIGEFVYRGM